MERKRTRLEIINDILRVIQEKNGKAKPTQILYKSNLSHFLLKDYLDELIKKKFILEKGTEKSKTYLITEKGNNYVKEYRLIKDFIDSFGLD